MKPTASGTTSSAPATAGPAGLPVSVNGSEGLTVLAQYERGLEGTDSWKRAALEAQPPREMRSIVPAWLAPAANWLAIQRRIPEWWNPSDIEWARQSLAAARQRARAALAPATPLDILDALEQLAGAFQVGVPDDQGLKVYVSTLQMVGSYGLGIGVREVAAVHRWPRLPFPAEILDHARPQHHYLEAWACRLDLAHQTLG